MDMTISAGDNFATSLDPNARPKEEVPPIGPTPVTSSARYNYTQSVASGKTPEQAAADSKLGAATGVSPEVLAGMDAQGRAEQQAKTINWDKMQQESPVLLQMMNDPTFAAEVSSDPREAGLWERLWWKLAPAPNRQSARNTYARGGYGLLNSLPIFGNSAVLEDCRAELQSMDDATQALKAGKTVAEVFGSEEDPTGEGAYARFVSHGETRKKEIMQRMAKAATSMAWANNMRNLFPYFYETQALFQADTAKEAFGIFAKYPLAIAWDLSVENLVQQSPQLAVLAVGAAAGGTGAAALGQGLVSYNMEFGSRMADAMTEHGLNPNDAKDILRWYGSNEFKQQFEKERAKVRDAAAAVAAWDAAAGGLVTKTLVPKGFMGMGERASKIGNVGVQSLLQGAMGGAGEASAQYVTEGKITSWPDIVAEVAAEFSTGPVDVAAAAFGRTTETRAKAVLAQKFAQHTAQLEQYAKVSPLLANDPKTAAEYVKNIKAQTQLPDLYVDVQSLHQSGQDDLIAGASPELAERYQQALLKGESMKVSPEELLTVLAPRDTNNALAEVVHPEGMPSLVEAQSLEQTAAQETSERLAQTLEGVTGDFATSSANVGKQVETMLNEAYGENTDVKTGGMSKSARQIMTTYLQTLFSTVAKDLGVLPEQVFAEYGPKSVLTPADATHTADGKLQVTSDRAKQLFTKSTNSSYAMTIGDRLQNQFAKPSKSVSEQELSASIRQGHNGPKRSLRDFIRKTLSTIGEAVPENERISKGDFERRLKNEKLGYIHISPRSARELSGEVALYADEMKALVYLEDVLKSGDFSGWKPNTKTDKKPNVVGYGVLSKLARIDGRVCRIDATIEKYKDGKLFYYLRMKKLPSKVASSSFKQGDQHSRFAHLAPSLENPVGGLNSNSTLSVSYVQGTIGEWFPDVRAIATWTGANRSTFLHETGHMFLDMRTRIAVKLKAKKDSGVELTKGEQHLLDSLEATMKWLGTDLDSFSKMSVDQQRPMHEKFARTYEAYVMEGNAPSSALTKIFRSFSAWLRGVYRLVSNIPDAEINPEVRELFDTLLVSSSEVETARLRRAQFERYNDPQVAAFAQEMGEDFAGLVQESSETAVDDLQQRLQKASRRIAKMRQGKVEELTDEAQRIYNEIVDRIWQEVMASPEYRAYVALTEGINGIKPKLTKKDLESVEPKLTSAQIKMLEDAEMVGTNPRGVSAKMVADKYGYDSVNALVFALLKLGDPTQHVFDLATTEMLEQHAELASPESIEQAADAAIFNDARLRILSIEAMAFNRALRKKGDVLTQIREGAKTAVGQIRLADMSKEHARHATEAARNARESEAARSKGDIKNAAAAKIRELYQAALVRVITVRRREIGQALKFFKKFKGVTTLKTCDTQYLMAIQHVLDKVGIAKFPEAGANQRQSLAAFLNDLNTAASLEDAEVKGIDIDSDFVAKIDAGELTLDRMTADQFEVLNGLVHELYTLGRNVASIEVEGQRVALEEARADLAEGIEDHASQRGKKPLDNYEKTGRLTQIKEQLHRIGLSHRRIPSLFNCMEGVMPGYGRFFKYITRKFDECGNRETALKNEITKALFEALEPMFKDLAKTKPRFYGSLGLSFTKQQIFVMALNMGNEGNIQRLVDNSNGWSFMKGKKLTQADVLSLIQQTLTADELNRVQAVWDLFATLQKEVEAKEIRMRGRAPAWVTPQPITMASVDGKVVRLKGGYYPIVYDRLASSRGQAIDASKGVLQELKGVQGQASTWKGHLKDRAKKVDMSTPLTLTLRGAFEGFENTIHDVCWDEWVTDTRRLFGRNSTLDNAIREYYGADTVAAIRQWIKDTAVGKSNQGRMEDGIATMLRKNISLVGIGFNLVTAAIQTVGITQTVVALGGKWTLSGLGDLVTKGPMGSYKFAASKSLLIQDRIRTQFREVAEIQRYTASGGNKLYDGFARMAYMPVAMVQMLVDLPTWMGAYNKALAEGKAEAEAVAMADRMLIEAQGSGRYQDLSGIERGGAWAQLFTVFYTFFNTTYNLARLTMETKGTLAAARDLTLLLVAQPVIETFIREALKVQPPDDDDDAYWDRMQNAMLANTINFNMSLFVGLRELASAADLVTDTPVFNYQGPTGLKKITDIGRWGQKAMKEWNKESGEEIDPAFIRQSITVFSEVSGVPIPVVPVNRYLRGKQAIDEGDTTDWKAYLFGYSKR